MSGELEPRPRTTDEARREPGVAGPGIFQRPDFVMVGLSQGSGVILFASLTLTEAELKRVVKGHDKVPITEDPLGPLARIPSVRISVRAEMQDFTQIVADSYPEAMQTLQEQWSRRQPGPGNALPPGI